MNDNDLINYKKLLFKYIVILIGRELLPSDVCPGCLDSSDLFSEAEANALHALVLNGDIEFNEQVTNEIS